MSNRPPDPASDLSGQGHPHPEVPRPYSWHRVHFTTPGEVADIPLGVPGKLGLTVSNEGNFPSWTCYVELYDSPPPPEPASFAELELRDRQILSLQPGETRTVALNWVRQRPRGMAFAVCYDPLLDPRPPVLIDHRRVAHDHY